MKMVKVRNDKPRDNKRYSCKVYIVDTLHKADYALTYLDFKGEYSYGTLRNAASDLVKIGEILKLPKENPARFILPTWKNRPEYQCTIINDKGSRVGNSEWLSYLEHIDWNSHLDIHNLKFRFSVPNLRWIKLNQGWILGKQNHSYRRKFILSSFTVSVQCFDTGSVLVSVKCSAKPFPLNLRGMLALSTLLGEVKHALNASCIPDVSTWNIVQWHLNRDSKKISGGSKSLYATFEDFFEDTVTFYYKHNLEKYRVEVRQTPNKTMPQVLEHLIPRCCCCFGRTKQTELCA
jgi:hypothetical protein